MARHLKDADVENIVGLIRNWNNGKLTWEKVCDEAAGLLGWIITRQTLFAHQTIRDAYSARKRGLRRHGMRTPVPSSLAFAAQRIARQEAENNELRTTNGRLLEQFVRWQYNSYKFGITKDQLNEELPRIDRERTDGLTSTELANVSKHKRS